MQQLQGAEPPLNGAVTEQWHQVVSVSNYSTNIGRISVTYFNAAICGTSTQVVQLCYRLMIHGRQGG